MKTVVAAGYVTLTNDTLFEQNAMYTKPQAMSTVYGEKPHVQKKKKRSHRHH